MNNSKTMQVIPQHSIPLPVGILVFMGTAVMGIWGISRGYPYQHPTSSLALIVAGFRILFAACNILRNVRSRKALALIWGWENHKSLQVLWVIWTVLLWFILLGLFTPIATALYFVLGLYIFARSKSFSLEDLFHQVGAFFLCFLNSSLSWSLDHYWGLNALWGMQEIPLLSVNLFFWSMALLMFSAGFEKFFSPVWQAGKGFYYFVAMPHLVQKPFRFLRNLPLLCMILSWLTIVGETSMFALALSDFRIIALVIIVGFGFGLMTCVDLSFIGQIVTSIMLFLTAVEVDYLLNPVVSATPLVVGWPLLTVISLFWVACCLQIVGFELKGSMGQWVTKFMSTLARATIRTTRIKVFTEVHVFGVYLYRLRVSSKDKRDQSKKDNGTVVLEAFDQNGCSGPYQRWSPQYFQCAMYPVTDSCIEYLLTGNPQPKRLPRLIDLCYAGMYSVYGDQLEGAKATLEVRVSNPQGADYNQWLSDEWVAIGECQKTEVDQAWQWRWLNQPPRFVKSYR